MNLSITSNKLDRTLEKKLLRAKQVKKKKSYLKGYSICNLKVDHPLKWHSVRSSHELMGSNIYQLHGIMVVVFFVPMQRTVTVTVLYN